MSSPWPDEVVEHVRWLQHMHKARMLSPRIVLMGMGVPVPEMATWCDVADEMIKWRNKREQYPDK